MTIYYENELFFHIVDQANIPPQICVDSIIKKLPYKVLTLIRIHQNVTPNMKITDGKRQILKNYAILSNGVHHQNIPT